MTLEKKWKRRHMKYIFFKMNEYLMITGCCITSVVKLEREQAEKSNMVKRKVGLKKKSWIRASEIGLEGRRCVQTAYHDSNW